MTFSPVLDIMRIYGFSRNHSSMRYRSKQNMGKMHLEHRFFFSSSHSTKDLFVPWASNRGQVTTLTTHPTANSLHVLAEHTGSHPSAHPSREGKALTLMWLKSGAWAVCPWCEHDFGFSFTAVKCILLVLHGARYIEKLWCKRCCPNAVLLLKTKPNKNASLWQRATLKEQHYVLKSFK